MEKVKLSSKQIQDVRNTVAEFLSDKYNVLRARLLTTMDSAIESDRQVEGMKARIKDVQAQLWDEIYRQKESILGSIFSYDAEKDAEGKAFTKSIERLIEHINSMIMDEFDGFLFRLKNLMGMIFSNSKLKCVVEEVDRIVCSSRFKLISGIAKGLRNKFDVSTDDVS